MNTGSRLDVKIRLTNYYVWASILIDLNEHFLHKFWPEKWWEVNFLNESEVYIDISGDFAIFTPVHINQLKTKEFNEVLKYIFFPKYILSREAQICH